MWRPSVDVYRGAKEWFLKFDLAGVRAGDLSISVEGSTITVRGVRRDWALERGWRCHSMEISYSRFERAVQLPIALDRATITAEHHEGMLIVRVEPGSEAR
jgi:HSP20 family protein